MELQVAPGVMKAPGFHLCLSYEQNVREAAMDLIRQAFRWPADRVRNYQEHKMIHWVQLLQPAQQKSVSAPASSSGSSSFAKLPKGVQPANHSSDVNALASKVDKLASTVKLLADRSFSGGKRKDRSSSPKPVRGNPNGSQRKEKERARTHSLSRN